MHVVDLGLQLVNAFQFQGHLSLPLLFTGHHPLLETLIVFVVFGTKTSLLAEIRLLLLQLSLEFCQQQRLIIYFFCQQFYLLLLEKQLAFQLSLLLEEAYIVNLQFSNGFLRSGSLIANLSYELVMVLQVLRDCAVEVLNLLLVYS